MNLRGRARQRLVVFMLLAAFGTALADDQRDALDIVAPLADALSNSDPDSFVRALPGDLPNKRELQDNVNALIAQAEVSSSVEAITATKTSAELDWYMEIRSRETRSVVERRRGVVVVQFQKGKLQSIEPASFFAPPKIEKGR